LEQTISSYDQELFNLYPMKPADLKSDPQLEAQLVKELWADMKPLRLRMQAILRKLQQLPAGQAGPAIDMITKMLGDYAYQLMPEIANLDPEDKRYIEELMREIDGPQLN
jgi:hypothetical protein